jgi:hypothetical protein
LVNLFNILFGGNTMTTKQQQQLGDLIAKIAALRKSIIQR